MFLLWTRSIVVLLLRKIRFFLVLEILISSRITSTVDRLLTRLISIAFEIRSGYTVVETSTRTVLHTMKKDHSLRRNVNYYT